MAKTKKAEETRRAKRGRSHARRRRTETARQRAGRRGGAQARARRSPEERERERLQRDLRDVRSNLREATADVASAAQAGAKTARHVAIAVQDRVQDTVSGVQERVQEGLSTLRERASDVQDRVGDVAEDAQSAVTDLPDLVREGARRIESMIPEPVREGARRGLHAVEEAGVRLVGGLLARSSFLLSAAADYVGRLASRRPADRAALERLLEEQAECAEKAAKVFDRAVAEIDDADARKRLVRFRLQAIKQSELLRELLATVRGNAGSLARRKGERVEERARRTLTEALLLAERLAENWRALCDVAMAIENGTVAEDLSRTCGWVGNAPDEQVEFLRDTLRSETVQAMLA